MIPILYEGTERVFTSNGLGRLTDCLSCIVTEERNGTYELEFQYPITGIHYDDIQLGRIVYTTHDASKDPQPFDIYKKSAPVDGIVTFYAHHVSYRLNNVIVKPFSAGGTVSGAMQQLNSNAVNPSDFTFESDSLAFSAYSVKTPDTLRRLLGGVEGSILDVYGGGDYEFNDFTVKLWRRTKYGRGADHGVSIRYSKNMTELKSEESAEGAHIGVVPYWTDGETIVNLPEWYLTATDAPEGAELTLATMDLSSDFEEAPTEEDLRTLAQKRLDESNVWEAERNIEISFAALWQTPEYADVESLHRVVLCDTVGVYYPAMGVSVKMRVIKVVWDALLERYESIELGTPRTTLADTISRKTVESVMKETPTKGFLSAAIDNATNLISGGLGGYVVLNRNADGAPQEILIMDTPSTGTAVNVIRMNKNGIGFSTSGYAGPFTSAWTIDGHFNADFIDTGTLNANLLKAGTIEGLSGGNSWNLNTGVFISTDGTRKTQISAGRITFYKENTPTGYLRPAAWGDDYENAEGVTFLVSKDAKYLGIGRESTKDGNTYITSSIVVNNGLDPDGDTEIVQIRASAYAWSLRLGGELTLVNGVTINGYTYTDGAKRASFSDGILTCGATNMAGYANRFGGGVRIDGNLGLENALGVSYGGTGKTSGIDAANYFLNSLSIGSSTPVDADYYISQYVSGGTTTTTYHRRPMSALWNYVQGKADSIYLQLAGGVMTGSFSLKTTYDASAANNGISSGAAYPTTFNILDKSSRIMARIEGSISSDGTIGSSWYICNYDTSGNRVATNAIIMRMTKAGVVTYTVHNAAAFRTALGLGSNATSSTAFLPLAGGTMTGILKNSTSIHLYGTTVGNDASALDSGVAGLLSWGDAGPQITFGTASTPGTNQAGALIFTDHDTAAPGVSWHFVSNQADWTVTSKRFHARTNISVGTDLPQRGYNLQVAGTAYVSGAMTVAGTLTLTKTTDASGTENAGPALIVGGAATTRHLELDSNEIMAKTNATTAAALYLNADGGEVDILTEATAAQNVVLGNSAQALKFAYVVQNSLCNAQLHAAANGNHGLYSGTKGGWIIYCCTSNNTAYIPRAVTITGRADASYFHATNTDKVNAGSYILSVVYNSTDYVIIHNYNNGNITISAAGGSLYLGYLNTTSVLIPKAYSNTTTSAANMNVASGGALARYASSSRRYKHNIVPMKGYRDVLKIAPVSFVYNGGYIPETDQRYGVSVPGLIAEDVLEHYPIAADIVNGEAEDWNSRYILPPMLAVLEEHDVRLAALEAENAALRAELNNLKGVA